MQCASGDALGESGLKKNSFKGKMATYTSPVRSPRRYSNKYFLFGPVASLRCYHVWSPVSIKQCLLAIPGLPALQRIFPFTSIVVFGVVVTFPLLIIIVIIIIITILILQRNCCRSVCSGGFSTTWKRWRLVMLQPSKDQQPNSFWQHLQASSTCCLRPTHHRGEESGMP